MELTMEDMTSETFNKLILLSQEYLENEVDAEDFLREHKAVATTEITEEEEVSFMQIAQYEEYLITLLKVLYDTKKFLREDEKYIHLVILYVICFKLPKMSESKVRELVFTTYPSNWKVLLDFFGKPENLTKVSEEGCKILDIKYCHDNILAPLQKKSEWMKKFSNSLRKKLYNLEEKKLTVPQWPFSHTPQKQEIPTYPQFSPDRDNHSIKEEKISKSPSIKISKKVSTSRTKHKKNLKSGSTGLKCKINNMQHEHEAPTAKTQDKDADSCKMEETSLIPKVKTAKTGAVSLNTTALLRLGATIQQNEWKQIKRLQELCNGGNDPENVNIQEEEIRKEKLWNEKRAMEARRLRALLWQEEATIAKEGVKKRNQAKALKVKAERDEIGEKKQQLHEKQEILIKNLVEKTHRIKVNAQNSVRRNKLNKLKTVKKLQEEKRLMKEAAQKKREEELLQKAELVQEIQRLHKKACQQMKKPIDLTETSQLGLSCEMSIAELKGRLQLAKLHLQAEIEERKRWIKGQQEKRRELLKQTEEYIAAHKESSSRFKQFSLTMPLQMQEEDTPEIAELKRQLEMKRQERMKITAQTKPKSPFRIEKRHQ
ncbi:trichohyalin-like [Ischnura elegans]|uniref:trichohyalin-like n=1 Tax=Ischnura elegans TaxID=197161 RepID=UPI001ED89DAD|nr:trichohyalin-like [Ischnura elegans]XP_046386134.1 trichohyalin-like [Ischnura elegans]